MAMAASISYQNKTHAVSICPLPAPPPASLMMEMIIVQILRHRIPPRASFRRTLIWTFQRRRTGIEITDSFINVKTYTANRTFSRLTESVGNNVQGCDGFEHPVLPQESCWCCAFDFHSMSKVVVVMITTAMEHPTYRILPHSSRRK